MTVRYEQIMLWQRGTMVEQIAADIGSRIINGKISKWDELPRNQAVAEGWNVSIQTVGKAKRLLASHGLLKMDGNRYYVA